MTDEKLLRKKIEESGLKIYFVARKAGLSYQGLLNKMRNQQEFRVSEIQGLADVLHLDNDERDRIFFAQNVDNLSTQKEG